MKIRYEVTRYETLGYICTCRCTPPMTALASHSWLIFRSSITQEDIVSISDRLVLHPGSGPAVVTGHCD